MPTTFKDIDLKPEIQNSLEELNFVYPTEIQKKAIPILISSDKVDFHGQAQTGTGKTLAFAIPLLNKINFSKISKPQALIIAPTRELAIQIYETIKLISKNMKVNIGLIYGGVSMDNQIRVLKSGTQIIVGTPGRIKDHISRKTLDLSKIHTLILDEADIMLDMGFKEDIEDILKYCPEEREIWLFSATVKSGVEEIKKSHMKNPIVIQVSKKQVTTEKTEQFYAIVPFKYRIHALTRFIQSADNFYGIIFCQTKLLAAEVAQELSKRGYSVGALHGDMTQAQRNVIIKKFKQKDFKILVATDVAARGIDVANLTYVINFSIPEDLESYVHRIGRTGRAGRKGTAITFINKSDLRTIYQIEKKFGVKLSPIDVPSVQMLINNALKEISHYLANYTLVDLSDKFSSIYELLREFDNEQLIKLASNLLYQKFMSNLDLEEVQYTHIDSDLEELQEISINLGIEDNISKEDIRNYLLSTNVIKNEQIKKIRVLNRISYVKITSDCSPDLINSLRDKLLKNKRARVNLTCYINNQHKDKKNYRNKRNNYKRNSK